MINTIDHIINIDLANKINMNQSINIKKNDTDSHKFVINIFNNSLTYNLTGTTSKIYFQKADDTKVFLSCVYDEILNNKLSTILTTQALASVGNVATEITIYGTSGEILTSVTFNFTVTAVIRDDVAIESTSEFTALTDALAVVTNIENKLDITEFTVFKADIATNKESAINGQILTSNGDGTSTFHYSTAETITVYGVKIDTTNSNPLTALTYTDDAIGFTPALGNNGNFNAGSWADKFPFNEIKPCLYKDGAVNYYLNPNDYTQKVDGVTASDITSGADGDVMIEFPKIWWKFETIESDLYVKYSDAQVDETYKCLAYMRGVTEKDFCYISAYMGYDLTSELRSLSGKTPTVAQTIGAFRTLAQANGGGYDQMAYYPLLMLQVLFTIMFKNRDSQTALGRGYVDGNSASIATGGANAKGLFYGETTGKLQNKFCGIEDFYGNVRYWIDGFFSGVNRNMLIANQSFNDTGSDYADYGVGAVANISGYIGTIQGGTETGFVAKSVTGSATTHYADYGTLSASSLPSFGGYWATADITGAFSLNADDDAVSLYANVGSRLLAL